MIISETAYQVGFGCDRWKRVKGLSIEEKIETILGGVVAFKSRPCYGRHGTTWRIVVHVGKQFVPRVPKGDALEWLKLNDMVRR